MANNVKWVPDLGAPAAVTAVDLVTKSVVGGKYNEIADYIMTGGGYLAALLGYGGDFVKNIGIASMPLTAQKVYERIRGAMGVSNRVSYRAVSRFPAPAYEDQFQGTRVTKLV